MEALKIESKFHAILHPAPGTTWHTLTNLTTTRTLILYGILLIFIIVIIALARRKPQTTTAAAAASMRAASMAAAALPPKLNAASANGAAPPTISQSTTLPQGIGSIPVTNATAGPAKGILGPIKTWYNEVIMPRLPLFR